MGRGRPLNLLVQDKHSLQVMIKSILDLETSIKWIEVLDDLKHFIYRCDNLFNLILFLENQGCLKHYLGLDSTNLDSLSLRSKYLDFLEDTLGSVDPNFIVLFKDEWELVSDQRDGTKEETPPGEPLEDAQPLSILKEAVETQEEKPPILDGELGDPIPRGLQGLEQVELLMHTDVLVKTDDLLDSVTVRIYTDVSQYYEFRCVRLSFDPSSGMYYYADSLKTIKEIPLPLISQHQLEYGYVVLALKQLSNTPLKSDIVRILISLNLFHTPIRWLDDIVEIPPLYFELGSSDVGVVLAKLLQQLKGFSLFKFVSDTMESCKCFKFNSDTKRYQLLTENQMYHEISSLMCSQYKTNHRLLQSTNYLKLVIKGLIVLGVPVSEETFYESLFAKGIPFKNGLLCFDSNSIKPLLRGYNQDLYTIQEPFDVPYISIEDTIKERDSNAPNWSDMIKFLNSVTRSNPYRIFLLRGFIRFIVLAQIEGHVHQIGLCITGPPNSSKSLILKWLQRIAGQGSFLELTRKTDMFTNKALVNMSLVTLSDINQLSESHLALLRTLLGRDAYNPRGMFEIQDSKSQKYKCQFVMTTNTSFKDLNGVYSDPAILSKLAEFEYTTQDSILPESMIPDLECKVDNILPNVINWAISMPLSQLKFFNRAYRLHELKRQVGRTSGSEDVLNYISTFLQLRCYWGLTNDGTTVSNLQDNYSEWLLENEYEENFFREGTRALFGKQIEEEVYKNFITGDPVKEPLFHPRSPRGNRAIEGLPKESRPPIVARVGLKVKNVEDGSYSIPITDKGTPLGIPFEEAWKSSPSEPLTVPDLFAMEEGISWLVGLHSGQFSDMDLPQ